MLQFITKCCIIKIGKEVKGMRVNTVNKMLTWGGATI